MAEQKNDGRTKKGEERMVNYSEMVRSCEGCGIGTAHLPSYRYLSLWWKLISYVGTQGHCDI